MALTDLSSLKTHLGIVDTSQDVFLAQLLAATEAAFLRLVDRAIEATDHVEYQGGKGTRTLILRERPVLSVSEVRLDPGGLWGQAEGAFASDTLLVQGVDWALVLDGRAGDAEAGRIVRVNGVWPGRWQYRLGLLAPQHMPGMGNIKVTYRAGYETVPADVQLAIWQACAELAARRATGLIPASAGFDGYSESWLAQQAADLLSLPGSRAQTVARYRRIGPRFSWLG